MAKRLTVVLSQGQSNNPAKRSLEEDIVAALIMEPGIEVTVIPNLYDLKADSTGMLCLSGIGGDMVILSWLFPRAAHWTLDRNGIRGRVGPTMLVAEDEDDFDDEVATEEAEEDAEDKPRVIDQRPLPNRTIFCLDLRSHDQPAPFVEEIKRIATSTRTEVVGLGDWLGGSPNGNQLARYEQPTNTTALNGNGQLELPTSNGHAKPDALEEPSGDVRRIEENAGRRWYPVIDYSRCTNCMECIDFCLFGVYGVDGIETILVEQPDNCRKGCPACSRVCPENAIIFPQHKTPAIAGSSEENAGGLKIDLSQLFGGPSGETAEEAAARERNEQLILAGREPVPAGATPRRQEGRDRESRDELDDLVDQLDELDL